MTIDDARKTLNPEQYATYIKEREMKRRLEMLEIENKCQRHTIEAQKKVIGIYEERKA